jgi:hypothetical protein
LQQEDPETSKSESKQKFNGFTLDKKQKDSNNVSALTSIPASPRFRQTESLDKLCSSTSNNHSPSYAAKERQSLNSLSTFNIQSDIKICTPTDLNVKSSMP